MSYNALVFLITLSCFCHLHAEDHKAPLVIAADHLAETQWEWPSYDDDFIAFKTFRQGLDSRLGTEHNPYQYFSQWDDRALFERLLLFGDLRSGGFLSLDPVKVGAIVAPPFQGAKQNGLPASLELKASGRWFVRQPNQSGVFPRVFLAPHQEVEVILHYPTLTPGTVIHLGLPGGGQLQAKEVLLDDKHLARFNFGVNEHEGTYPVECYVEGDRKTVNFWVGAIDAHLSHLLEETSDPALTQNP